MEKFREKYRIQSNRLEGWDYSKPGAYFITLITYNRDFLFGKILNRGMILNQYGLIVQQEWLKSEKIRTEIKLDIYQIMPNHIHAIVWIMNMGKRKNNAVGKTDDDMDRADLNRGGLNRRDERPFVSTNQNTNQNTNPNTNQKTKLDQETYGQTAVCPVKTKQTIPPMRPHSLSSLMAGFESSVTKKINMMRNTSGEKVWQNNYHDHVIRDHNELNRIRNYIRNNPKNWKIDEFYL